MRPACVRSDPGAVVLSEGHLPACVCAGGEPDGTTVFVKGFNRELGEDEVRSQLMEAFKECGEISAVRLPTDRDTGDLKGIGFVEFATPDGKVRFIAWTCSLA